jgi:PAS domain S-box-containing protein
MTSIKKFLLQHMVFIAVISFVCLYFLWVLNEYAEFKEESASIKENFVASEKERLKTQVQAVLEYVQYMRGQTKKRLEDSIQARVNEACLIAVNIYHENKDSKSGDEIKKMIKDALRPIRFNRNRGYYFAFTMEGIEELFADRPEMEGKNMLPVQGARGEFVVRDMIQLIKAKNEGFYSYTWSKPGEKNPEHLKMAYVKYFEPYGWGIGTGEYVADVETEIQEEVLERISKLRFENQGYFFGSIYGGQPLFTNGKITKGTANVWNLTDPKGVKIIQEQNRAAKAPGGGFVSYSWQKMDSGTLSPKLSYVAAIPEWEWIIGAGVYLDTMDEVIISKKKELYHNFLKQAVLYFAVMIFMFFLILLWTHYQAHRIQSGIRLFSNFFETASSQATAIDPTKLQFEEFRRIAMAANQMIEARTKAVQSLRESEEKYRKLVNTAPYGIQLTDREGKIIFSNPAHHKLQGYRDGELIGKYIWDLMADDSYKSKAKEYYQKLIEEQPTPEIYFNRDRNQEGREMDVQINWDYIYDSKGKIEGIISIISDITDQKMLESRLLQSQKMEAVGTLAGGIAHDFNNILFPIIGHTEMLLEDISGDGPVRDSLQQIYSSALRARDLVQQILAFARQEKNELKLIKMQPIVKEALKLIRSTIPTSISIAQDIQADCGAVKADPTQIHQITMNLAANAFHAMEETGGELKVGLKEIKLGQDDLIHSDMVPGAYACLTFADNGMGIKKEVLHRIFEPFFTTKKKGKGTGMGLSVVHGIVKRMNGAIQVHSEPGKGTQFHVYLPIVENVPGNQSPLMNESIAGGLEKILLVDDEAAIITMEKQVLERLGYQVTSRTNGFEALETFKSGPDKFDLVITDMSMPKMPGDKLAAELIKIRPDIPILLCTGFSENMTAEKIQSLGIKGLLMKPMVTRDLAEQLRKVLDGGRDV